MNKLAHEEIELKSTSVKWAEPKQQCHHSSLISWLLSFFQVLQLFYPKTRGTNIHVTTLKDTHKAHVVQGSAGKPLMHTLPYSIVVPLRLFFRA